MEVLLPRADAVITFTVNRFASATQGHVMLTSNLPNPDVTTDLAVNNTGRVTRRGNNEFELSGSGPQGNPLILHLVVLPKGAYAAVDLVIRRTTAVAEGGVAWDPRIVGHGNDDNIISVIDHGRIPSPAQPITYEIFMFIRQRNAGDDYAFGDIGVIDPVWINR